MNSAHRKPLPGTSLEFYDAREAVDAISPGAWERLPYTSRVLAENLVRRCEPATLAASLGQLVRRRRDLDFPWFPARVVCHDILGQTALVDLAGLRDAIAAKGGDPAQIHPVVPTQLVVDHSLAVEHGGFEKDAFAKNRAIEDRRNADRFHFIQWTKKAFRNIDVIPPGNGILHQINIERMSPVVQVKDGVAYPDTLIGTDSHTPMVDALGVVGIGVGGLEAESVMLGRAVWMRLPDIVGVRLTGKAGPGITATDVVLALTEFLRRSKVVSTYLEFFGPGAANLTLGDRATISNMAPEFGATAALFAIDERTLAYLKMTAREPEQIKLVETYAKAAGLWADSLGKVEYERVLEFDLGSVVRTIAGPANPHQKIPTSTLTERGLAKAYDDTPGQMPDGAVIIAAITSCTNTSNPSVLIAAGLVAKKADEFGLKPKPWVKTSLAPGSQVVTDYLIKAGLQVHLDNIGFNLVGYGCTTCIGNSGPLAEPISKAINEHGIVAASVISGNRNFEGRVSPDVRANFLASPPLVVAYALKGTVIEDFTTTPIGTSTDGVDVYLKDIWPTNAEVAHVMAGALDRAMFRARYADVYKGDKHWQAINVAGSETYQWRAGSTYVANPPYFDGLTMTPEAVQDIIDAKPLLILGDSITTDHISPAGNIKADSPAGEWLQEHQVAKADFNSYGARRGHHEVMMRGTFANIRIKNEMVPGTEGGLSRYGADVGSVYDVAMQQKADGVPTVVIAGKEYGTGSSRDWAAKGTKLLGVRTVIVESFERIHRSNLVGMGVLPLQFKNGDTRLSLGLTGDDTFTITGVASLKPRQDVDVVVTRKDGTSFTFTALCRIDTANEIEYFNNGGILQYVLRKLAA